MFYIVYREDFKTNFGPSGGGYYAGYKNKIEDHYTPNWIEAKKFKLLGAAVTRLHINLNTSIDTIEKFIDQNSLDHAAIKRNNAVCDVLDLERDRIPFVFKSGRIDKVSSNGEFLGNAEDDLLRFINIAIAKNKLSNEVKKKKWSKLSSDIGSGYIIDTKDDENFWDGF